MTAVPMERPQEPGSWFLMAGKGRAAVRIRDGLAIGEDAAGALRFVDAQGPGAWVRFDIESAAITVRVVSRDWTLACDDRIVGDTRRLVGPALVELPHHVLQLCQDEHEFRHQDVQRLRLTRRYSINWLKPSPPARDPGFAESVSPAPPEVAHASEIDPPATEPLAPGRPAAAPGAGVPAAARPARARSAAARPPAPQRVAEGPSLRAIPATARPPSRRARRAPSGRMRWSTTLVTIVVYLAALAFSEPVATPLNVTPMDPRLALAWQRDGFRADSGLLGDVERLVEQDSPSRETLQFAIEAYRSASTQAAGDNDEIRQRLRELEARLAAHPQP